MRVAPAESPIVSAELQAKLALGVTIKVERSAAPSTTPVNSRVAAVNSAIRNRASGDQIAAALAAVNRSAINRSPSPLSQQDQLLVSRFAFMPSAADIQAIRRRGGARKWLLDQLDSGNPTSVNFIKRIPKSPDLPRMATINYARIDAMQELTESNRVKMLYDAMNGFSDGTSIGNGIIVLRHQRQFEQRIHMRDLATTERPVLARLMYFLGMQMLSVNFELPNESRYLQGMMAHDYLLDTIGRNMFGTYPDMVVASFNALPMREQFQINQMKAFDVATQNYGRELLQLHTLGVGNYTQEDIVKVSKMLSANRTWLGWGNDGAGYVVGQKYIESWSMNAGVDPASHSLEDLALSNGITVTGENGLSYRDWVNTAPMTAADATNAQRYDRLIMQKQHELIRKLALHPSAANRFCTKMIEAFLGPIGNDSGLMALRSRMVKAYMQSGGHIISVLRVLLNDSMAENPNLAAAMKPWETIIGIARASNLFAASNSANHDMVADEMVRAMDGSGHGYYAPPTVEGYKDDRTAWINDTALVRYLSSFQVLVNLASAQISARDFYNNTLSGVARSSSINAKILDTANPTSMNHDPALAMLATVMSDFSLRKTAKL